MKTTIDIPDAMLKEAMRNANTSTKRDAVLAAIEEYNRRRRAQKVIATFGTFKNMMSQKELREMRSARDRRHDARWHGAR
jgi:Arc/MetJ family transcription regulator